MKTEYEDVFDLADLIHKVLKEEATDGEIREYERWLGSNPDNRNLIDRAVDPRTIAERYCERQSVNAGEKLREIRIRTTNAGRKRRIYRIIPYAAAVAVTVTVAAFHLTGDRTDDGIGVADKEPTLVIGSGETLRLLSDRDSPAAGALDIVIGEGGISYAAAKAENADAEPVIHTLNVPAGNTYNMTLPDGSKVWLNSMSRLSYPVPFGAGSRVVELSGEAYFEVKSDENTPFRVMTGNAEVTALGTAFNVTAYEDEGSVAATLVNGAVEFAAGGSAVRLKPGEQALFAADVNGGISVCAVDPSIHTSWITGVLIFENITLSEICLRLGRWYDVEFAFVGNVGDEKFSGGTWMSAPLDDFLDNITLVTNVKFTRKQSKITVSPK